MSDAGRDLRNTYILNTARVHGVGDAEARDRSSLSTGDIEFFYWLFLQQLRSFEIILHQSIHTELYLLSLRCFSVLPSGWSCWPWFSGRRWWGWKHNYSDREQKHSHKDLHWVFRPTGEAAESNSVSCSERTQGLKRQHLLQQVILMIRLYI